MKTWRVCFASSSGLDEQREIEADGYAQPRIDGHPDGTVTFYRDDKPVFTVPLDRLVYIHRLDDEKPDAEADEDALARMVNRANQRNARCSTP